jgi:hypothetical protein
VADLEQRINKVASYLTGDGGLCGPMGVSLHRSRSLELDAFSQPLSGGICGAYGVREWQRLLTRDYLRSGWVKCRGPTLVCSFWMGWRKARRWWERAAFAIVRPKITVDLGDQRHYCCTDVLSMSTDLYDA